jgi:hypothetical protein
MYGENMIRKAHLIGDQLALSQLAMSLTGSDINLTREGDEYLLSSDRFDGMNNDGEVFREAQKIVDALDAFSHLILNSVDSLRVCAVYQYDSRGGRGVTIFPEPAVVYCRVVDPTVTIGRAGGSVEVHHPADPVKELAMMALSCPEAADVCRLLSSGKLDWVNLYRIIEIIAKDVGKLDEIVDRGWATAASIRSFKHTACSPTAVGLQARHGAERTKPPSKPMSLGKARSLVRSIIEAWLREKS